MNRESTKSYYCHICAKNFCWTCHQQLNLCQCFVNPKIVGVAQNQKRKKLLKKQKAEENEEQNSSYEKSEGDEPIEQIELKNDSDEEIDDNVKKPKSQRKNKGGIGGLMNSAFGQEKSITAK